MARKDERAIRAPRRRAPARLRRREPPGRPTHTHSRPRCTNAARRDARWTRARSARSGERRDDATRRGGRTKEQDRICLPRRRFVSSTTARLVSVRHHADRAPRQRRAAPERRRASMSSRSPRFEDAFAAGDRKKRDESLHLPRRAQANAEGQDDVSAGLCHQRTDRPSDDSK